MIHSTPKVNLLVLRVTDLEKSEDFYQKLGMSFNKHSHGDGPVHLSYENDGFVFELYPLKDGAQPTISTRIGFQVDDVDQYIKTCEEDGIDIVSYPKETEWGRRTVIKDPDGHVIELVSES